MLVHSKRYQSKNDLAYSSLKLQAQQKEEEKGKKDKFLILVAYKFFDGFINRKKKGWVFIKLDFEKGPLDMVG